MEFVEEIGFHTGLCQSNSIGARVWALQKSLLFFKFLFN